MSPFFRKTIIMYAGHCAVRDTAQDSSKMQAEQLSEINFPASSPALVISHTVLHPCHTVCTYIISPYRAGI